MKILHLLQSNRFSGAENVVCQIIKMAEKNDDNIKMVYCSRDGQIRESLAERGINFVPIDGLTVDNVKRIIKEQNPDVIHAHDRQACITAVLAAGNIPIIGHMHVNNNKGFSSFIKNVIWTVLSKKLRHIFWVSDSAYEQFQFKKIVQNKSTVLYNVLDIDALYEKANKDENVYDYDIVYIGRLSYQKNPDRLMKVLHDVVKLKNDTKAAIVGTGDYSEYVIKYIEDNDLKNNISYLGYNNNPLKILSNAKVMVMTSRFEGTPMVALEAQCLGVPVVSTPVDGMKTVITDGYNGYLTDNDEALVASMLNIISDLSLCEKMKNNSLNSSREYNNVDKFYKAISDSYYSVGESL